MGILFSSHSKIEQTKLITTIHCDKCKGTFLFNHYYKHLPDCSRCNRCNRIKNVKKGQVTKY